MRLDRSMVLAGAFLLACSASALAAGPGASKPVKLKSVEPGCPDLVEAPKVEPVNPKGPVPKETSAGKYRLDICYFEIEGDWVRRPKAPKKKYAPGVTPCAAERGSLFAGAIPTDFRKRLLLTAAAAAY